MSAHQRQTLSPRPHIAKRRPCADTTNAQHEEACSNRLDSSCKFTPSKLRQKQESQRGISDNQENVQYMPPISSEDTPGSMVISRNRAARNQLSSSRKPSEKPSSTSSTLRRIAIRVVAKLKQLGGCTYVQVADALVQDVTENQGTSKNTGREVDVGHASDHVSVRRRVYDALNVLVAAGVVTRTADRSITWNWLFGADPRTISLFADVADRRASIESKRAQLEALRCQAAALEVVVARNAARCHLLSETRMDNESRISFPFMLVSMDHTIASAVAEAESPDQTLVSVTLGAPFQILDDRAVLTYVAKNALTSGQYLCNPN